MAEKKPFDPARLDVLIAVLIALASLTTALAAWRTNVVSSTAADASRQGLIDAMKQSAAQGEDWRKAYQEAGYARDYLLEVAAADALDASGDPLAVKTAANLRQYLLPGLEQLAAPMSATPGYRLADGTFDLPRRFAELEAETPDLAALNPQDSFDRAAQYHSEERWLAVGLVLLAISLFWLALAEINSGHMRVLWLVIGAGLYLLGVIFFGMVEVIFFFLRGGAS